ncbi:hypothetical protein RYX36_023581, partial [Vicia faba]
NQVPELADAINLGELNLSSNHLTGKILKELEKLSFLYKLLISNNHLSGEVPELHAGIPVSK